MKDGIYKLGKILLFCSIIICIVELILRFKLGFCDAVLFEANDKYEYIAQPNQTRTRFGVRICFNTYSQRSAEPDVTKTKILGLGDSILYGGSMLDQDSIATSIFTRETGMQMLNIATGSWGPDNCAAYLRETGLFDAKAMVLVCSSHDAYDVMSFTPVVDHYATYPSKQYTCAVCELVERYFIPCVEILWRKAKQKLDPDEIVLNRVENGDVKKKSFYFNSGFDELKMIADEAGIPFKIYLHAECKEIQAGDYNEMGQAIMAWADCTRTELVSGLQMGETEDMYMDAIHFNEKGQRHLADCLKQLFQ